MNNYTLHEMTMILQRRLNGRNEIVKVHVDLNEPGVKKFHKFLGEVGMKSHEGLVELAQVLKISIEDMLQTTDKDLIEGEAQKNIIRYVRECRINGTSLAFLRSQEGNAGIKNATVDCDNFDFKDRCG